MKKAEALALYNKLTPVGSTRDDELIKTAKHLGRLQGKRRGILVELRKINTQIRDGQREIKRLKGLGWEESGAGSKILGLKAGQ